MLTFRSEFQMSSLSLFQQVADRVSPKNVERLKMGVGAMSAVSVVAVAMELSYVYNDKQNMPRPAFATGKAWYNFVLLCELWLLVVGLAVVSHIIDWSKIQRTHMYLAVIAMVAVAALFVAAFLDGLYVSYEKRDSTYVRPSWAATDSFRRVAMVGKTLVGLSITALIVGSVAVTTPRWTF